MRIFSLVFFIQLLAIYGYGQNPIARKLKVISVEGNAYEKGFQHGQQLKKEIAELLPLWKADLLKKNNQSTVSINISAADTLISNFIAFTNFIPAIKKYTPELLKEVEGIAVGSGQSFNDMYAYQLIDELWVYIDKKTKDTSMHHCSSLGVPSMNGRLSYIAQNLDLGVWLDHHQTLLHIKQYKNEPEQYILTAPGIIALNGMNQHGIGVCANTLMQLKASNDGLPVAFIIRGLLAKTKGTAALNFLRTVKHASGQNYILGLMNKVYDYEASSQKVVQMKGDASGIVYHTNHPLVNDDIKPWYEQYYKQFLSGQTITRNSETRLTSLKNNIGKPGVKDDKFIKASLRAKDDPNSPVCRDGTGKHGFNYASTIMTLMGKRSFQIAPGPPDESDYQIFYFGKK